MEKRILLSFVISFIILIAWQKMFPIQPPQAGKKEPQVIGNKEVMNFQPQPVTKADALAVKPVAEPAVTQEHAEEESVVVNNGKIEATLSSRGGIISQAEILEYQATLQTVDLFGIKGFENKGFTIVQQGGREVVFKAQQNGLEVQKIYRFSDDDFLVSADVVFTNRGRKDVSVDPAFRAMLLDMNMAKKGLEKSRNRNLMEYSALSEGKVFRKTGAYKFTEKDKKSEKSSVEWLGFRNRYYCTIFKPKFLVSGYAFSPKLGEEKELSVYAFSDSIRLKPGESKTFSSEIYIGPQNVKILSKYNSDFEKIKVYFRLPFFDSLAKIIEDLVILMHKAVRNWGVAIILVSLLIYGGMYPMTMKSMLSMRKMQSLQPKIVELREKYEKNPQKLNQEIMKLYAENKVNPLGGCLPLLFQMPIFICLYQMIWRSVIFKGSGFLWIKDLSEPDRLFILNKSFPIIGNEINILPFIILILMVVQQRMTAKNMASTDPNQLAQQRMMTFMMPILLLFVFYRIASGLTLYLTVFYTLSSFTQWRIAKKVTVEK